VPVAEYRDVSVTERSWERLIEGLFENGVRLGRVAQIEAPGFVGGGEERRADETESRERAPTPLRKGDSAPPGPTGEADADDRIGAVSRGASGVVTVRIYLVPKREAAGSEPGKESGERE
jgi:hypothetical protein